MDKKIEEVIKVIEKFPSSRLDGFPSLVFGAAVHTSEVFLTYGVGTTTSEEFDIRVLKQIIEEYKELKKEQ